MQIIKDSLTCFLKSLLPPLTMWVYGIFKLPCTRPHLNNIWSQHMWLSSLYSGKIADHHCSIIIYSYLIVVVRTACQHPLPIDTVIVAATTHIMVAVAPPITQIYARLSHQYEFELRVVVHNVQNSPLFRRYHWKSYFPMIFFHSAIKGHPLGSLSGVILWGHYLGSSSGVILWGHPLGSLSGVILWGHPLGSSSGVIIWGHPLGSSSGVIIWGHPLGSLSGSWIWFLL